MTYRKKYKQLHPDEDMSDIHLDSCPDILPGIDPTFPCPFPDDDVSHGCRDCWDTEIPATEEDGV